MKYRAEIISNQSVEDDIVELLEEEIKNIQYTIVPDVQGKGLSSKKLGDSTWPEMNFMLITYINEADAKRVKTIIAAVKEKFPREGISVFFTPAADI